MTPTQPQLRDESANTGANAIDDATVPLPFLACGDSHNNYSNNPPLADGFCDEEGNTRRQAPDQCRL